MGLTVNQKESGIGADIGGLLLFICWWFLMGAGIWAVWTATDLFLVPAGNPEHAWGLLGAALLCGAMAAIVGYLIGRRD